MKLTRVSAAVGFAVLVAVVLLHVPTAWADGPETPSPTDVLPPGDAVALTDDATTAPTDEDHWFLVDVSVGYDFTRGHDSSDIINGTEEISWAYGAMTLNAFAAFDLGRATGGNTMRLGLEGSFGFGSYIRFWTAGIRFERDFALDDTVSVQFGLGIGATQLSSGGRDVTDAAFVVLRDYLIATGTTPAQADAIAADETVGKRIHSPISVYFALQPGLTWHLDDAVRLFVDLPIVFSPATSSFTLSGRTYDRTGDLVIPGFHWQGIGVGLTVGAAIGF